MLSVCLSRTGVFTPPRSPYGAFSRLTSALNLQLLFDAKGLNVAWAGYINSNHGGCMMSFKGFSLKISNANKVNRHNLNARNEMNLC